MLVAHWSSRCPGTSCSVQRTHARPLHLAVAPRGIKSAAASTAAVRQQLQGSHGSSRHRGILLVVRVAKSLLDVIEGLKQQADELQAELGEAGKAAEVAARRSRRLAERSRQLQDYALEHVALGDESSARAALLQKASVADALAAASRRAEANIALARKLEYVLTDKQLQLLRLIRQAKEQADTRDAAAAAAAAAEAMTAKVSGGSTQDSRSLKRSRSVSWESPSMHASSDASGYKQQARADGGSRYSNGSEAERASAAAGDESGGVGPNQQQPLTG